MPRTVSKFIAHNPWSIQHKPGTSYMSMQNVVDARKVDVQWDIVNETPSSFLRVCVLSTIFHDTIYRPKSPFASQSRTC
jgi:hypothetical protein